MKLLSYFLPLFILISASTISLGFPSTQDEPNHSPKTSQSKIYKVHFISLKRGHSITSSHFNFEDNKKFEIQIPGEKFLEAKGNYTKNSLQFEARWEGTIIKHNQHYCYTFAVTGISLLDSYLAGMVTLNESIEEIHLDQKVTFLFIGTLKEDNASDNKERKWFPF